MTGDNVTAMCLTDYDGDGSNEVRLVKFQCSCGVVNIGYICLQLIVGSDDFDIRVFKNDEIIDETNESDAIVSF